MKYQRAVCENVNPFNDESEVRCQTFKLVKVRKRQQCLYPGPDEPEHFIEPGQHAVCERAIVEGEWTATYACLPCMDAAHEAENGIEACTKSPEGLHSEEWFGGEPCAHCGANEDGVAPEASEP